MTDTMHAVDFDAALMARYDVPAPRYTSYPTAPQFHARFREPELRSAIAGTNGSLPPRPLSLYIHVPFCWSPCFYCGCNRIITHDLGRADQYLGYLGREIDMAGALFDPRRPVRQLHFGGGTPNFLDLERLGALMAKLRGRFHFAGDATSVEAGIEVDPRFADFDYVTGLGGLGFNRISIGVQDFEPEVQKAVNRIQSVEQTTAVVDGARGAGFRSVNIDLIYGLPKQTLAGFERTLDKVLKIAPDRVAVYGYAHLPRLFKAQRQIESEDLPDAATRLALFGMALETLRAAGYVYIGMDHFARATDELVRAQIEGTLQRNFQGYSTKAQCDIVGLGVSAIGRIGNTYSQNARELPGYYLALENDRLPVVRGVELNEDDLIRRDAIGELMCHGRLDTRAFGSRHGIDFRAYFDAEIGRLRQLEDDGLVRFDEEVLQVTPRGRLLLRVVAMQFDAYLARDPEDAQPRYARSI